MDCVADDDLGFLSPLSSTSEWPDVDQLIEDCDHLLGAAASWLRPPSPELDILCRDDDDDDMYQYAQSIISTPMLEPTSENQLRCTDTTDEDLDEVLGGWTLERARQELVRVREPTTCRVLYVDGTCLLGGLRAGHSWPTPLAGRKQRPPPARRPRTSSVVGHCEDCKKPFLSRRALDKHCGARRYRDRFPCLVTTCTAVFSAHACRDWHITHTHI